MKQYTILLTSLFLGGALLLQSPDAAAQNINSSSSFKWLRSTVSLTSGPYSEGLSAFYEAGKWGYEDKDGNIVIPAAFEDAKDFNGGLAIVKADGKWGVIDNQGKFVFNCIYDSIEPFSENVALAYIGEIAHYLYTDGKSRVLPSSLKFYSYHNGLAKIEKERKGKVKYGYINKKGRYIIDPIFDAASDFSGSKAFVIHKNKAYTINKKGKKTRLSIPLNPANEILFTNDGSGFIEQGGKYLFVKYTNGIYTLMPKRYDFVSPFKEGRALVQDEEGNIMYINTFGEQALTLTRECTAAGNFSEGLAWVRIGNRYGYINKKGDIIIDTIFSYASDFSEGLAHVSYNGRNGVIRKATKNDSFPHVRISNTVLQDENGNGIVEAGEKFTITATLTNQGNEAAKDIKLTLTGKSGQGTGFTFNGTSKHLEVLQPNEVATLVFEAEAGMELRTDDIEVNINAVANNQLATHMNTLAFSTIGISECEPLMASYWVHTPTHTALQPGGDATLEVTIRNNGTDVAKDVTLNLQFPSGVRSASNAVKVGDIKSGESRQITHRIILDTTVASNTNLSIVATLTEFTKKHNDIKYLQFETGKMNAEVSFLSNASNQSLLPAYYAQMQEIMQDNGSNGKSAPTSELLTGLVSVATPDIHKYALIIGNEDYNSFKQQTSYEPDVDFAVNDATVFNEYAKKVIGVPEENIIFIKNATYSQMKFNINKLSRIAKLSPGNIELYVYYAGHGQVDGTSKESYLIPVDVSTTSPTEGIRLEDMYASLSNSGCKRALVFLDACYSGVGRGIVRAPKEVPVKGNLVIMTASSAIQRSMPYKEKQHGMFTYFLLKKIKSTNGQITIGELFQDVKSNVQSNSVWINDMEQTPELIGGVGIESGWQAWPL